MREGGAGPPLPGSHGGIRLLQGARRQGTARQAGQDQARRGKGRPAQIRRRAPVRDDQARHGRRALPGEGAWECSGRVFARLFGMQPETRGEHPGCSEADAGDINAAGAEPLCASGLEPGYSLYPGESAAWVLTLSGDLFPRVRKDF